MYQFKGHSARKSAVLVLAWCYKTTDERERDLRRYWLPEGCIKQWYDKPTSDCFLIKKRGLQEQWSSGIAVSSTVAKHSDILTYRVKTQVSKHDSYHW